MRRRCSRGNLRISLAVMRRSLGSASVTAWRSLDISVLRFDEVVFTPRQRPRLLANTATETAAKIKRENYDEPDSLPPDRTTLEGEGFPHDSVPGDAIGPHVIPDLGQQADDLGFRLGHRGAL